MKDLIRHGDLLLRPAQKPTGKELTPHTSKVVLEGEVTGHAHRFTKESAVEILDYYETSWRTQNQPQIMVTYVQVETPSIITHEEHGPLPVQPGFYEVIRAREFDYAAGLGRRVRD